MITSIHAPRLLPAAVRPLPNRRHPHTACLAPSPEGQWRRPAARPARRRGQSPAGSVSATAPRTTRRGQSPAESVSATAPRTTRRGHSPARSASRSPRRFARAFTLLEALIAVGMMVLLLGALAMFVEDLSRTRQFVARTAAETRSADALFGALEAALQTAVVDGGNRGAGVTGTDRSIRVLSSRTDAGSGSVAELARAAFSPLSATQVDQNGANITIGRGGVSSTLPATVRAMRVRYWYDGGWGDSFDSLNAGTLPAVVEVGLWFGATQAADEEELGAPDRVRAIAVPDAAGAEADFPAKVPAKEAMR